MKTNNKTVQRTWMREDTLTMLLAIPLVLCITYKDIQNNGADDTIKRTMSYMYYVCSLSIANANLVDLHQQAGDMKYKMRQKSYAKLSGHKYQPSGHHN